MPFINPTDIIGTVLDAGTQNATGSMLATLFFILFFLIIICVMFGIPLEFVGIILLPLCLAMGSYYSDFFKPLIVLLVYIAMLLSKNWLFK